MLQVHVAPTALVSSFAGQVALLSAMRNAPSLVPILLYPGKETSFVRWFEKSGGVAFPHSSSLRPRWQVIVAHHVHEGPYNAHTIQEIVALLLTSREHDAVCMHRLL